MGVDAAEIVVVPELPVDLLTGYKLIFGPVSGKRKFQAKVKRGG